METDTRVSAMEGQNRHIEVAKPFDTELGPLGLLPGKWVSQGRGWNMIALPFAQPGFLDYRLLLNQFDEVLNFTLVDKGVPNRGVSDDHQNQTDQLVVTLDYEQVVHQVAEELAVAVGLGLAGGEGFLALPTHGLPHLGQVEHPAQRRRHRGSGSGRVLKVAGREGRRRVRHQDGCVVAATTAVVGDNVTMMAKNKGVVAIVIDGMARDSTGIVPVGLPVFSRGITPNSCVRSGPGRVGMPVVVGGVLVHSGDIVIGDRDGIVVIPQGDLERLQPRIDAILKAEVETQARIRGGFTNLGGIEDMLKSSKVRYVD